MNYKNPEYIICKQLAIYLRLQYPKVLFHWDLSGLNLSKAQAGMNKAIQCERGWPDLFIVEKYGDFNGLFIEIKSDNVKLIKKDGTYTTTHIKEQSLMIEQLDKRNYAACFAIGFNQAKEIIDSYLRQ